MIPASLVKELREKTGAGMMDCKKALAEAGGDMNKAIELLREKGLAAAAKKAGRIAAEGIVDSYIHMGGRIGVLVEVNCETDFVTRTDEFRTFVRDMAMQIAASNPQYIFREDVPQEILEKEREILRVQAVNEGKPEKVIDKIVDGKTVSSKAVSTQVLKEPVNCINLIGTKVKVLSARAPISAIPLPSRFALDSDGIPTAIKDTITGVAKSYTCNISSYKGSGGTASGVKAQSGYIAVNPKQIPYGTEMYIVSSDGKYVYGYCIAADTGGFAKKGTAVCDLYMDTLNECRQWGSRNVNIYILNWGNGRVA